MFDSEDTEQRPLGFANWIVFKIMPVVGPGLTVVAFAFWIGLFAGVSYLGFCYAIARFGDGLAGP